MTAEEEAVSGGDGGLRRTRRSPADTAVSGGHGGWLTIYLGAGRPLHRLGTLLLRLGAGCGQTEGENGCHTHRRNK